MDNRFQEEFPSSSGAFDDNLFEAENSSSEETPINSSSGAQTFGDTVTSDNATSPQATTDTAAENKNNGKHNYSSNKTGLFPFYDIFRRPTKKKYEQQVTLKNF